MSPTEHIKYLQKCLSNGLYEKDDIMSLALLCAISGESCFLLGPPGTAKSEISRRLKLIFQDATAFEYLMSRFSTPDEIFGPVSIQKLKSEDTYCRKVDGFLPSATIVFLDEIWKAGPAIQNALLTVVNEHIFQNGTETIHVPLKCLIAASNELPAENEGLEALWDRFLVRVMCNCIEDEDTFYKMLLMQHMPKIEIPQHMLITPQIYKDWQERIPQVNIPNDVLACISRIRKLLAAKTNEEGMAPLDYYISDRRWRKIVHILRTSAFLNGRSDVDVSDLVLLTHILWNKAECIPTIIQIVMQSIYVQEHDQVTDNENKIDKIIKNATPTQDNPSPLFKKYNYFYIRLLNYPGDCYFYFPDYAKLQVNKYIQATYYYDTKLQAHAIRLSSLQATQKSDIMGFDHTTIQVRLCGDRKRIIVDNSEYKIETTPIITMSKENRQQIESANSLTNLLPRLKDTCKLCESNIFVSLTNRKLVSAQMRKISKRIQTLLARIETLHYV